MKGSHGRQKCFKSILLRDYHGTYMYLGPLMKSQSFIHLTDVHVTISSLNMYNIFDEIGAKARLLKHCARSLRHWH